MWRTISKPPLCILVHDPRYRSFKSSFVQVNEASLSVYHKVFYFMKISFINTNTIYIIFLFFFYPKETEYFPILS